MISKKFAGNILFYPPLIILTVLTIFPLLYVFFNSFREYWLTNPEKTEFIWFNNYVELFKDPLFIHSLKITIYFVLIVVSVELIIGMILALLLNKNNYFNNITRGILLLPMMVTPVVLGLLWKFMYDASFGILNYFLKFIIGHGFKFIGSYEQALISVAIVDIWQWTPFVFLLISAGLRTLPQSPYEAASIDGANEIQKFFYITIPLIKKVIIIAILFRFIDALKTYDIIYSMTNGGPSDSTMLLAIYNYRIGFKFFNLGYGSSIAIFQVILMLILLIVLTKMFKIKL